jgi:NADPH:quinone reductase-like Zn-dependent oxidoreductase
MSASIPEMMKAVTIDRFGGPEVLQVREMPIPTPGPREVLIRLDSAGIGVWDPEIRAGELELGAATKFPRIIGNDGAGTVAAVGESAQRFKPGDRVYAFGMDGGFYAEYVAVQEQDVAPVPAGMSSREAGALGADGIAALRGLEDQLRLRAGESLMIFGASGGVGHIAVQLAKRMRARVLAVASGADGVDLVRRLGADRAIDGRREDVGDAARLFAPQGLDAALVVAGAQGLDAALEHVKPGGRVAYPNGVEPAPRVQSDIALRPYDGTADREAFDRLNRWIGDAPFHVELGRTYRLEDAVAAHAHLGEHHLGKVAFEIRV